MTMMISTLLTLLLTTTVTSTILYTDPKNTTFGPYPSMPALFGPYISPERNYTNIYYDPYNPSGCPDELAEEGGGWGGGAAKAKKILEEPTALLVVRGVCSFEEKVSLLLFVVVWGERT